MDDHVMMVQAGGDDIIIKEVSREHMLDINEITQKSRMETSFEQWAVPALTALVHAMHEPEHAAEFNKYWYDTIVVGSTETLIREQENKLQMAEASLQHIIEISNTERANQLAHAFRQVAEAHRLKTSTRKAHIANLANRVTTLDSNISRLVEECDKTLLKIRSTKSFLQKCTTEASDTDALWKERILETIEGEYEKFVTLLRDTRMTEMKREKQQVLDLLTPVPQRETFDENLIASPQLLSYQKACSDHADAIGLWNMLLIVSCVSGSIGSIGSHS